VGGALVHSIASSAVGEIICEGRATTPFTAVRVKLAQIPTTTNSSVIVRLSFTDMTFIDVHVISTGAGDASWGLSGSSFSTSNMNFDDQTMRYLRIARSSTGITIFWTDDDSATNFNFSFNGVVSTAPMRVELVSTFKEPSGGPQTTQFDDLATCD
jgi:hypothetical protein